MFNNTNNYFKSNHEIEVFDLIPAFTVFLRGGREGGPGTRMDGAFPVSITTTTTSTSTSNNTTSSNKNETKQENLFFSFECVLPVYGLSGEKEKELGES